MTHRSGYIILLVISLSIAVVASWILFKSELGGTGKSTQVNGRSRGALIKSGEQALDFSLIDISKDNFTLHII